MSKQNDKPEIAKREVGEKAVMHANFEPTKTKDLGEGIIEAVITTGALDHHNENILIEGVDTSSYHGVVLWGHDYDSMPIGKTISMTKMKNKIKAKFQLAVKEFPFAKLVYDMIAGGYVTDVSIGGIVKRWSDDYQTIEEMVMKEFSVVPIGANEQAMITAFKALDINEDTFKKSYEDFQSKIVLDKLASMPLDEAKDAIRVLKNLTARLEETAKQSSLPVAKQTTLTKRLIIKDAKAIITQGQTVIRTIKLTMKENNNE